MVLKKVLNLLFQTESSEKPEQQKKFEIARHKVKSGTSIGANTSETQSQAN